MAWPTQRRQAGGRQALPAGDPQLPDGDVDAGEQLRHGVLDLQAGVHLDEREPAVAVDQELDRAGVDVVAGPAGAARGLGHRAHGWPRPAPGWAPPRSASGACAAPSSRARPAPARRPHRRPAPASRRGGARRSPSRGTCRRPRRRSRPRPTPSGRPPRPGPARRPGACRGHRRRQTPSAAPGSRPGRPAGPPRRHPTAAPGCPAPAARRRSRIVCLARLLSPISSIASADGPTNTRSLSSQARTKPAFSARNPQPGWTASQPVVSAAAIRFGTRR